MDKVLHLLFQTAKKTQRRFTFMKNRKRIKYAIFLFLSILSVYVAYVLYLVYICIKSCDLQVEKIVFDSSRPETAYLKAKCGGAKAPLRFAITNMKLEVNLFDNKFCNITSDDIFYEKNDDLKLKNNFKIEYNKNYDVKKLHNIRNIKKAGLSFKVAFKFKFLMIPIRIPYKTKLDYFFAGNEPPIKFNKHKIIEDELGLRIESDFELTDSRIKAKVHNFSFAINLNSFEIGNVFIEANEISSKFTAITQIGNAGIEKLALAMPIKFDNKKIDISFVNFMHENMVENKKNKFYKMIENTVKAFEIHIKNPEEIILRFKNDCPGIDTHLEGIIDKCLIGQFKVHRTFVDNFIPSFIFFNNTEIPQIQLKVDCISKNSFEGEIAQIEFLNIRDKEYFKFKYKISNVNFDKFLGNVLEFNNDNFLKISLLNTDFLGRIFKNVHFLWNFRDNFGITANNFLLSKKEDAKNLLLKNYINTFNVHTKINEIDKSIFEIVSEVKWQEFFDEEEFFKFSWNDIGLEIDNDAFKATFLFEKSELFCMKNFDHVSDIFKGREKLFYNIIIEKTKNDWKKALEVQKNETFDLIIFNFSLVLFDIRNLQDGEHFKKIDNENKIFNNMILTKKNFKTDNKPFLAQIINKINIKLGKITSCNNFELHLSSHPIFEINKKYCINFIFNTPILNLKIKGGDVELDHIFADVLLSPLETELVKSQNTVHSLRLKNTICKVAKLDITVNWSNFKIYDSIKFVADDKMSYFSYFVNSCLGTVNFRRPSTNCINLEGRYFPEIFNFTKEPINLTLNGEFDCQNKICYSDISKQTIKFKFKAKFPQSALSTESFQTSNFSWPKLNVLICGYFKEKKYTAKIVVKEGSLGLRLETDCTRFLQKEDSFEIELNAQLGIFLAEDFEFSVTNLLNHTGHSKFDKKQFFEFFNSHKVSEYFFVEKNRFLANNCIKADLIYINQDQTKNILKNIGSILQRINFVNYPRNINLDVNIKIANFLSQIFEKNLLKINSKQNFPILYQQYDEETFVFESYKKDKKLEIEKIEKKETDFTEANKILIPNLNFDFDFDFYVKNVIDSKECTLTEKLILKSGSAFARSVLGIVYGCSKLKSLVTKVENIDKYLVHPDFEVPFFFDIKNHFRLKIFIGEKIIFEINSNDSIFFKNRVKYISTVDAYSNFYSTFLEFYVEFSDSKGNFLEQNFKIESYILLDILKKKASSFVKNIFKKSN